MCLIYTLVIQYLFLPWDVLLHLCLHDPQQLSLSISLGHGEGCRVPGNFADKQLCKISGPWHEEKTQIYNIHGTKIAGQAARPNDLSNRGDQERGPRRGGPRRVGPRRRGPRRVGPEERAHESGPWTKGRWEWALDCGGLYIWALWRLPYECRAHVTVTWWVMTSWNKWDFSQQMENILLCKLMISMSSLSLWFITRGTDNNSARAQAP